MNYPNIIVQALNQLGEGVKMTEPGHWQVIKAPQEPEPGAMYTATCWDNNVFAVVKVGGALIKEDSPLQNGGMGFSQLSLLYPAEHSKMRTFFDKWDFGWDEFTSVLDGKHPLLTPNTRELIAMRKAKALEIFDAMAAEVPVMLVKISRSSADVVFGKLPARERVDHWANLTWNAYCENYGREDETRVDPEGAHTKKDCFRLARKFGYFHLGMR